MEFLESYYLVRLARSFLFDNSLTFELSRDPMTVLEDEEDQYPLRLGEYTDKPVRSPSAFLVN